jgi:predicted PurR-regulated permease PerM
MLKELIKKIELQSVLVLFITILFGYLLLRINDSLTTPSGVLGSVSIAFGIVYTFGSFFSNQIRESYKDIIAEYKNTISMLRTSHRDIEKSIKSNMPGSGADKLTKKQIGKYQATETDSETSDGY